MPDMSVTINSSGRFIEVSYSAEVYNNTAGTNTFTQVYIDGLPVGPESSGTSAANGYTIPINGNFIFPVSPGVHKVDLYWSCGTGTSAARSTARSLKVREL
jgi:hypothetical protein